MPDLNIRNVTLELIVELKKSALDHGVTLREFCIGVLSGPRLGFVAKRAGVAQLGERRLGTHQSKAGETRKVEGSIPSPGTKIEKSAKAIAAKVPKTTVASALVPEHSCPKHNRNGGWPKGAEWYCSDCKKVY